MHLSDDRSRRFYDLLDSLTVYANAVFGVTDPKRLLGPNGGFNLEARAAVHEKLWADPTIIDDYIADNPIGLPPRELAQMHRWKQRLTGPELLLGFDERGCALFSVGERRVAVQGITHDIIEVIVEQPPTIVHVTLLPFDDVIVYDALVMPLPVDFGPAFRKMLESEAREARSHPVVESADEFVELAKRVNVEREWKDWDRFQCQMERERWERDGSEPTVPGVHRGVLAGLSEAERESVIARSIEESLSEKDRRSLVPDEIRILKQHAASVEPASSFEGSLMADNKSVLERDAQNFGITGYTKMRKAELAHVVAQEYLKEPEGVHFLLAQCAEIEFETICSLLAAEDGRISFDEKDAGRHLDLMPLPPVSRLYWHKGIFTALIPDEVRMIIGGIDLDKLREERQRAVRVERLAEALAELCGIVSVDDLVVQYERFYAESIACDQLLAVVIDAIERDPDEPVFEVWTGGATDGTAYVIHQSMGDAALANDVAHDLAAELSKDGKACERLRDKMMSKLARLRDERDEMLRDLVSAHEQKVAYGIYPVDRTVVETGVYAWKLHLPAVVNLRNWLDAHVPDEEDDFLYADDVIDELLDAQLGSSRPTDVVEAASEMGVFETSEDVEGAVGRVMAFANALPDWWNNGWPPDALHERVTGRRVFRNPDGAPMKIGRNDPCPCGSGKKYKKCCGR